MEKVYKVSFMTYTNPLQTTVSDNEEPFYKGKIHYLNARDLLVKESDLAKYSKYGEGYASITFVGYLAEED